MDYSRQRPNGDWEHWSDGEMVGVSEVDPISGNLVHRSTRRTTGGRIESEAEKAARLARNERERRRRRRVMVGCLVGLVLNVVVSAVSYRVYMENGEQPGWLAVPAMSIALLGWFWLIGAWTHRPGTEVTT